MAEDRTAATPDCPACEEGYICRQGEGCLLVEVFGDEPAAAQGQREWACGRSHGGWHYVYDGSGIVRAEVCGWKEALRVCRVLADRKGEPVRVQTEDDLRDPMFTEAMSRV